MSQKIELSKQKKTAMSCASCYARCVEKTPYRGGHVFVNGMKTGKRWEVINDLVVRTVKTDENVESCAFGSTVF
jgi:hypothetical protein